MFAIIRSGGKQYRVVPKDVIAVEKIDGKRGEQVEFTEVLALFKEEGVRVGQPLVEGARVQATVLEQAKGSKILVFKKKRRHNYRRKAGHRQQLTVVRIDEVLGPGEEPSGKPAELKPRPQMRAPEAAPKKAAPAPKPAPKTKTAKPAKVKATKASAAKAAETKEAQAKPQAQAKKPEAKEAKAKALPKKAAAKATAGKKKAAPKGSFKGSFKGSPKGSKEKS